jgi:hypothetical protein
MRVFVSPGVIAGDVRDGITVPELALHAARRTTATRYESVRDFIDEIVVFDRVKYRRLRFVSLETRLLPVIESVTGKMHCLTGESVSHKVRRND